MKEFKTLLLLALAALLGMVLFACLSQVMCGGEVEKASIEARLVLQALGQVMMFFVPVVLTMLYLRMPRQFLKVDFSANQWRWALYAALIMILLVPMNDWLTRWNEGVHLPEKMSALETSLREVASRSKQATEEFLVAEGWGRLFLNLIVLAAIPAICEEVFFRGMIQPALQRWTKNAHVGIILAAAVFSLAHGEMFDFLPRFVLGLVLGYMYYASGSMLVNVVAHFVNNAAVVVIYAFYSWNWIGFNPIESPQLDWWIGVVCLAIAGFLFYCIVRRKMRRNVAA